MIVRFGMALDGMQPLVPVTAAGEVSVGPAGLLGVLETQLGLPTEAAGAAEEITAYRACIDELADEQAFYGRSYQVDAIGVARSLLDWRASWYEHGWQGSVPEDAGPRLQDMARLEALAARTVPLCRGQRAQRILKALDRRRTQIERPIALDPLEELPLVWRELLTRLGAEPAAALAPSCEAPGCDLHTLQRALTAPSGEGEREVVALAGDASFVVVRAVSRDISARLVAEHVRRLDDPDGTLLFAERDGIILDNALSVSGLPRAGFQHFTRFRAVSQVLPLALGLVWSPLGLKGLLQFLQHPVSPLRRRVRARLAEAVARQPGVGGAAWREALREFETEAREEGADEAAIARLRAEVADWMECAVHDPESGAPAVALVARTQACANWLAQRLNLAGAAVDREVYARAYRQAADLMQALARRAGSVSRVELDHLLDEVMRDTPDPDLVAEAGHARAAATPGAIGESWRRVIWWDLAPAARDVRYPWSDAELVALRACGVALPEIERGLEATARQRLLPVLAACEQLVLVVHERETAEHPLWTQVKARFEGWRELWPDTTLLGGRAGAEIPELAIPTQAVPLRPLPGKRRWWQLDDTALVGRREAESYSSLDKLLSYPHEWVLRYLARLRPGRAQALASGGLLYGNLAHALFERFFAHFADWRAVSEAQVQAWLGDELPRLILTEGALLLEPGAGVERERFIESTERALLRLLAALREAGVARVHTEHAGETAFEGGRLQGIIDLLLRTPSGGEIVLDVKWGGESYRGESLRENRYLQLAAYACLRHAAAAAPDAPWPAVAYFIAQSGAVLAHDHAAFPNARTFPPADGGGPAALWQAVVTACRWRWEQLSHGLIEVNVEGTSPDEHSSPPPGAYRPSDEADRFDDYTRLTGWEESA